MSVIDGCGGIVVLVKDQEVKEPKKEKSGVKEKETYVAQSVLGAYGRLRGQINAICQLYEWVTKSCESEKN